MIVSLALRHTRLRLTSSRCLPSSHCTAHSWSPVAPTGASRLAFFDSHPASAPRPGRAADVPPTSYAQALSGSQALYGQLVVSALLRADNGGEKASGSSPEPPQDSEWISDHEWEIRTGRAIYILQQTLPDYFQTGLVSSLDIPDIRSDGQPPPVWSIKSALGLSRAPDTLESDPDPLTDKGTKSKQDPKDSTGSIYSPRVRLSYTPPTPLPAPFPKTLHVEGLHLYIASAVFLRHTLNAIYTDLHIHLRRVRVQGVPDFPSSDHPAPDTSEPKTPTRRASREKCFIVGLTIHGIGRVSKAPVQWEVNCTYTFSPTSGLILQHSIDSIEPAPTQALFEALGKFGLLGGGGGGDRPGGAGVGS